MERKRNMKKLFIDQIYEKMEINQSFKLEELDNLIHTI
jgi:hypothetical protein